jgi:hypothetical protein
VGDWPADDDVIQLAGFLQHDFQVLVGDHDLARRVSVAT